MPKNPTLQTSLDNGRLTQEAALSALSAAAITATNALPGVLLKCESRDEMRQVIDDRDACQLAYTNALVRSLRHSGPLFEQTAADLEKTAKAVGKKAKSIKTAAEALSLFADLVRLSSKLALAFA